MSENKEIVDAEVVKEEDKALVKSDASTLLALQKAEIDQAIATAKAYPRNLTQFKSDLESMATLDQETAEAMWYTLPRDGKAIEGPSIRLAEIAGSCWGNVRYGTSVVEVGDDYLVARGYCYDLQRNVGIESNIRLPIVNKHGKRYSSDMISVTGRRACAIALRNAIFKVVPAAYIKPVMDKCKQVAGGDIKTLSARRDAALLWFKDKGYKPETVFHLLEVKGADDITLEHIAKLQGIRNAVKDGEATLEAFFQADHTSKPSSLENLTETVNEETGEINLQKVTTNATVEAKNDAKPEDKKAKKVDPEDAAVANLFK